MSIQAKEKGASFQSADRKRTLGVGRALEPSREDGELSPRDVNSWWRKRHQEPDHHFVQIVMVRHPNPNPAPAAPARVVSHLCLLSGDPLPPRVS